MHVSHPLPPTGPAAPYRNLRVGWEGVAAFIAYVLTILGANVATANFGMVAVGFGLAATAGTYLAGLVLLLRDVIHDLLGRGGALAAVAAGALLSGLCASWALALASVVAFTVSELADMAVYTPLRRRGWALAVTVSGLVGAVIDSVLFLQLAGFDVESALAGQLAGKAWLTVVPPLVVSIVARWRRAARVIDGDV